MGTYDDLNLGSEKVVRLSLHQITAAVNLDATLTLLCNMHYDKACCADWFLEVGKRKGWMDRLLALSMSNSNRR